MVWAGAGATQAQRHAHAKKTVKRMRFICNLLDLLDLDLLDLGLPDRSVAVIVIRPLRPGR
jgi:hypothetical protein